MFDRPYQSTIVLFMIFPYILLPYVVIADVIVRFHNESIDLHCSRPYNSLVIDWARFGPLSLQFLNSTLTDSNKITLLRTLRKQEEFQAIKKSSTNGSAACSLDAAPFLAVHCTGRPNCKLPYMDGRKFVGSREKIPISCGPVFMYAEYRCIHNSHFLSLCSEKGEVFSPSLNPAGFLSSPHYLVLPHDWRQQPGSDLFPCQFVMEQLQTAQEDSINRLSLFWFAIKELDFRPREHKGECDVGERKKADFVNITGVDAFNKSILLGRYCGNQINTSLHQLIIGPIELQSVTIVTNIDFSMRRNNPAFIHKGILFEYFMIQCPALNSSESLSINYVIEYPQSEKAIPLAELQCTSGVLIEPDGEKMDSQRVFCDTTSHSWSYMDKTPLTLPIQCIQDISSISSTSPSPSPDSDTSPSPSPDSDTSPSPSPDSDTSPSPFPDSDTSPSSPLEFDDFTQTTASLTPSISVTSQSIYDNATSTNVTEDDIAKPSVPISNGIAVSGLVGGILGFLACLLVFILIFVICICHNKKKRQKPQGFCSGHFPLRDLSTPIPPVYTAHYSTTADFPSPGRILRHGSETNRSVRSNATTMTTAFSIPDNTAGHWSPTEMMNRDLCNLPTKMKKSSSSLAKFWRDGVQGMASSFTESSSRGGSVFPSSMTSSFMTSSFTAAPTFYDDRCPLIPSPFFNSNHSSMGYPLSSVATDITEVPSPSGETYLEPLRAENQSLPRSHLRTGGGNRDPNRRYMLYNSNLLPSDVRLRDPTSSVPLHRRSNNPNRDSMVSNHYYGKHTPSETSLYESLDDEQPHDFGDTGVNHPNASSSLPLLPCTSNRQSIRLPPCPVAAPEDFDDAATIDNHSDGDTIDEHFPLTNSNPSVHNIIPLAVLDDDDDDIGEDDDDDCSSVDLYDSEYGYQPVRMKKS